MDWRDEAAFRAQLDPAFAPKVDLWDRTFTMPFHAFRQRVKEIAQLSLSRVRGAACARWDEIPDGALVIPIDDDDWLAADAADALDAELRDGAIGYHWTDSHVEVPLNLKHRLRLLQRSLFPWTPPFWICSSNNYAFVKRADMGTQLLEHSAGSRWFEQAPVGAVHRIERRLSVQNRTLASQTSLAWRRPSMTRRELVRKFRGYQNLYSRPVASDLAWCRPYLGMMAELMSRLRLDGGR